MNLKSSGYHLVKKFYRSLICFSESGTDDFRKLQMSLIPAPVRFFNYNKFLKKPGGYISHSKDVRMHLCIILLYLTSFFFFFFFFF